MEQSELLAFFIEVLERLELDYFIAGSVATSYYGEPRFTNDIDVVVQLTEKDVSAFCESFPKSDFYISENAVKTAVFEQKQFNILHPTTGLKIDIFVLDKTELEKSRFARRKCVELEANQTAWFARPEDVILKKLVYYYEGQSEKHIRDILGVLKIQGDSIDFEYLNKWATQIDLLELWQSVIAQINPDKPKDTV